MGRDVKKSKHTYQWAVSCVDLPDLLMVYASRSKAEEQRRCERCWVHRVRVAGAKSRTKRKRTP